MNNIEKLKLMQEALERHQDNNLEYKWTIIAPHYNGGKKIIEYDWAVNENVAKHQAYTKMSTISVNKYPDNPYFLRCIIQDFSKPHGRTLFYKIEPGHNSLVLDTKDNIN